MMIFVKARMALQLNVVYFWGKMAEIEPLNISYGFILYPWCYFVVFLSMPSPSEVQHSFISEQRLSDMVDFIVNFLHLELAIHGQLAQAL